MWAYHIAHTMGNMTKLPLAQVERAVQSHATVRCIWMARTEILLLLLLLLMLLQPLLLVIHHKQCTSNTHELWTLSSLACYSIHTTLRLHLPTLQSIIRSDHTLKRHVHVTTVQNWTPMALIHPPHLQFEIDHVQYMPEYAKRLQGPTLIRVIRLTQLNNRQQLAIR